MFGFCDDDDEYEEGDVLFSIIPAIEPGIAEQDEYSLPDEEDEAEDIDF